MSFKLIKILKKSNRFTLMLHRTGQTEAAGSDMILKYEDGDTF